VSQYISLTKFDKGKLLALERDRMGFTREQGLDLKERGSVSRSTAENQDVTGLCLHSPIANPLRVADPRSARRAAELTREFERRHQ